MACAPPRLLTVVGFVVKAMRRADRRELSAHQIELLPQPVQHPVDLAGLVAAQCLGELDGVHVGTGDAGGRQDGGRGGPGQRRKRLAPAEQHAAQPEQHDGHQNQHYQIQQNQRHAIDIAGSADSVSARPQRHHWRTVLE